MPSSPAGSTPAGSERANYQLFITDLCELLDPAQARPGAGRHARQRLRLRAPRHLPPRRRQRASNGFIDCYKRGHFVLEAKKIKARRRTKGFDDALLRARSQAEHYARALPADEGRPPFLIVIDVGRRHRAVRRLHPQRRHLHALPRPAQPPHPPRRPAPTTPSANACAAIWLDPLALDPARLGPRHARDRRPSGQARQVARSRRPRPEPSPASSPLPVHHVRRGRRPAAAQGKRLHRTARKPAAQPAPVRAAARRPGRNGQRRLLRRPAPNRCRASTASCSSARGDPARPRPDRPAARSRAADWTQVEPAIFGTLLERALDPPSATPSAPTTRRAPTSNAWCCPPSSSRCAPNGATCRPPRCCSPTKASTPEAVAESRLPPPPVPVRVLDPACGSGNFPVRDAGTHEAPRRRSARTSCTTSARGRQPARSRRPHRRPAPVPRPRTQPARRRHRRTGAVDRLPAMALPHPRQRPAAAAGAPRLPQHRMPRRRARLRRVELRARRARRAGHPLGRRDDQNAPRHRRAGAGRDRARAAALREPAPAEWPQADYIVGNPPFIGAATMRAALGDGYVEALRGAWPEVPESADFVMFWWHHAARTRRAGQARRFGFITTNSLKQTFNRRVVQELRSTLAERLHADLRSPSPFPTTRGWTAPMARRCALR
jgi:hypothetical protein